MLYWFFILTKILFSDAVDNLCVYASSSEFVTIPAKIPLQARQAQQPIIEAGRRLIDSSCSVIGSTKNLIIMPKDPSTWQNFAANSKSVSDSIKQLVVNIRYDFKTLILLTIKIPSCILFQK